MITVMGATGHSGTNIAAALLKGGEPIRALGRSESKLVELRGPEPMSSPATRRTPPS